MTQAITALVGNAACTRARQSISAIKRWMNLDILLFMIRRSRPSTRSGLTQATGVAQAPAEATAISIVTRRVFQEQIINVDEDFGYSPVLEPNLGVPGPASASIQDFQSSHSFASVIASFG